MKPVASLLEGSLPFLSGIYLFFLFFLAVRSILRYRQSGSLRHQGLHKTDPGIRLFVDTTRRTLGIQKKVSCWLSSFVEAPLTIGFLKPVILLPVAITNSLTTTQVEAILLHELAHIKRNDYLLNLLMTIVATLFFFNPFAKLFVRAVEKEREHCCDDWVLQFRYDPHSYASALLLLAKPPAGNPSLALAATGWSDGLLLQRVKRILKLKNDSRRPYRKPVIGFLLSSFAVSILLFHPGAGSVETTAPVPASRTTLSETRVSFVVRIPRSADGHELLKKSRKKRLSASRPVYANQVTPAPIPVRRIPADAPSISTDAIDAVTATRSEPRDFSIQLPIEPTIPDARSFPGPGQPGQPFVPGSSFSYKLTAGNSLPGTLSRAQIAQAIRILLSIDWNVIQKQLPDNGQFNAQKLLQMKTQVLKKIEELTQMYRAQPDDASHQPADSTGKPSNRVPHIIIYI
jgi:hypothetical protein